jgi:hypothetical protein
MHRHASACIGMHRRRRAALRSLSIIIDYRDFSHTPDSDCCVPDIDCRDCRHYAAGSAIVSSRLNLHVQSEYLFRGWLDYVDTYLATFPL